MAVERAEKTVDKENADKQRPANATQPAPVQTTELALVETQHSPIPVRFAPPTDADTLVDALVAG